MKMFRKDEGFTLVELMVVVLIIGILVAIAIPIFNAAKGTAQLKTCFANQRTIEGAAQTYAAQGGTQVITDLTGDMAVAAKAAMWAPFLKLPINCPTSGQGYYYDAGAVGGPAVTGDTDAVGWTAGHSHF